MKKHSCNVGEKLQAEIPDHGFKYIEYMPLRTSRNSFYLEPVTSEDIKVEIKRMKPNKSQGLIGITVIKSCPGIFANNLATIYHWSIENGFYPQWLEIVKVIALYKKEWNKILMIVTNESVVTLR